MIRRSRSALGPLNWLLKPYSLPGILVFRNAGRRSTLCVMVCSLAGCLFMLHLYYVLHQKRNVAATSSRAGSSRLLPAIGELERVEEEEDFMFPIPKTKASPRALKRRRGTKKRHPKVISEFLNESSDLRSFIFPDSRMAVDPTTGGNESMFFYPGRVWLDTEKNPIQAHGGGVLLDEKTQTYYWYGENKDGPTYHAHKRASARVDIVGVSCYSSKDLWSWKNEGIVLPGESSNTTHDLYKLNVLERPKVIYNKRTDLYVMWMHIDDANYTKASVGVAVSKSPTGPFIYLFSHRPHGFDSRDMTVFKDEDDQAYLVYSSMVNRELHIGRMTDNYLEVSNGMRRVLVGLRREAPLLFKHQGIYYMITSGCSGWAPNGALVHASESIMGPWELIGNPCVGGNKIYRLTTFFSQGSHVLPLPGIPGSFIFMADRWSPSDLRDSRYVWLPLTVERLEDKPEKYSFSLSFWSRVSIFWHRKWRIPEGFQGLEN